MFFTPYKRPNQYLESNNQETVVDRVGYMSAQKRIENMILAGQRLKDFRAEQFDFSSENEIDFDASDPTRRKNFDMADAFQLGLKAEQNLKESQKNALANKDTSGTLVKSSQTELEQSGKDMEVE